MPKKVVELPLIGEVTLVKRRGAKNLRLSIAPNGNVRVSLPYWAPYSSAIAFAASRAEWIMKNKISAAPDKLIHGHRIGKSYRLNFISSENVSVPQARLGINSVTITSGATHSDIDIQKVAKAAAERALRKEAKVLLGKRLVELSVAHGFKYSEFKIKRLSSRWGSCSNDKVITLNYYLIQLPWELIDYVIIHELAHTRYLNHSRDFWNLVESIVPDAKKLRKTIKDYRPILMPAGNM